MRYGAKPFQRSNIQNKINVNEITNNFKKKNTMNGILKIRCIEVTKTLEEAEKLFEFVNQTDSYNEKRRLVDFYVHLGSLEQLKKAVQYRFSDGTTILEDFSPEPVLPPMVQDFSEQG